MIGQPQKAAIHAPRIMAGPNATWSLPFLRRSAINVRPVKPPMRNERKIERPVELSVRLGLIRVSPHLYNTEEDIAQLIDGIRQVV